MKPSGLLLLNKMVRVFTYPDAKPQNFFAEFESYIKPSRRRIVYILKYFRILSNFFEASHQVIRNTIQFLHIVLQVM